MARKIGRGSCLAFVFSLCVLGSLAHGLEKTKTAGWYLDVFGSVDACKEDADDRVQNNHIKECVLAYKGRVIFNKVKRASTGVPVDTDLFIVGSDAEFAIALPDGNIVVSISAIKLAYQGVDEALGDARIAFILGHELAHQANRDFWIENFTFSGKRSQLPVPFIKNSEQLAVRLQKESKADEAGFINASLAGFRTDRLISSTKGSQSFIEYWVNRTNAVGSKTHPEAGSRAELLRKRLAALEKKTELFKYGVRLAHFGRYDDARQLLLAFERDYPSREVLNNLGYVHLQTARQKMPQRLAYRFWFPTLLETNIGLNHRSDARSWITDTEMPDEAIELLEKASEYLQRAVKMDKKDIVSRANLVAVNLYLGKAGTARDLVDEMARIKPGDTRIMGLRALVLYHQDPEETWNRAKKILQPLSQLEHIELHIIYNYSRLMQERGRHEMASESWRYLASRLNEIPEGFQLAICKETIARECDQPPEVKASIELGSFWHSPLRHGADLDSAESRKRLHHWHDTKEIQIGTINTRILTSTQGDTMLALDSQVELAMIRNHPFESSQHLMELGKPSVRYPLASGEIWSYGSQWSALVDRGKVKEVWVASP